MGGNANGVGLECLGYHRGAIDTTTVTTKPPPVVMNTVRRVLHDLGIQVQEESTYNYRCIRARRQDSSEESLMVRTLGLLSSARVAVPWPSFSLERGCSLPRS